MQTGEDHALEGPICHKHEEKKKKKMLKNTWALSFLVCISAVVLWDPTPPHLLSWLTLFRPQGKHYPASLALPPNAVTNYGFGCGGLQKWTLHQKEWVGSEQQKHWGERSWRWTGLVFLLSVNGIADCLTKCCFAVAAVRQFSCFFFLKCFNLWVGEWQLFYNLIVWFKTFK